MITEPEDYLMWDHNDIVNIIFRYIEKPYNLSLMSSVRIHSLYTLLIHSNKAYDDKLVFRLWERFYNVAIEINNKHFFGKEKVSYKGLVKLTDILIQNTFDNRNRLAL